ncbi:MAG TPA: biosynthetic peptidoglycan transglycosylase [Steroidobacteraceae bacterium]|nr:biosynthetic peptidoglycan transglycosylase [Steroidobacteraceae bacterium]
MLTLRTRRLWWWLGGAIAAALVASLAVVLLLKPMLERAVRARIESAAARHGMVARIGTVRVGLWPFVRLTNFDLDLGHGARLHADTIAATYPGQLRLAVGAAHLSGPAGVTVGSSASAWSMAGSREDLQLTLIEPQTGLSIHQLKDAAGSVWNVEARALDVGHLFDVQRNGAPFLDGGIADGRVELRTSEETLRFHVDIGARGARFGLLAENDDGEPQLGDATDVTLRFDAAWKRAEGSFEIPEIQGTLAGADLSGSIQLRDLDTDPTVDMTLGVKQLEFARLLGAAGLAVPENLGLPPGASADLGSVSMEVGLRGRSSEPATLAVTQKINFTPPDKMPPAISRLRTDFVFRSNEGLGPHRPIDVSPASADFIALHDVPPLFVRTLLISEDAGFYGHKGIDLRELPSALLTNYSRGGAARGASTITQQLAKNLFLSRDKEVGRKLQELAITFLLESELGKDRILEIYLNIIEWGPDLRGLRPAARHYFDCEPQALTPAQMAFLVAIIPGPIKYQRSLARGTPSPGLRVLIDNLLAKLRSVDAIGEEEYQRALSEPIVVAGALAPG